MLMSPSYTRIDFRKAGFWRLFLFRLAERLGKPVVVRGGIRAEVVAVSLGARAVVAIGI